MVGRLHDSVGEPAPYLGTSDGLQPLRPATTGGSIQVEIRTHTMLGGLGAQRTRVVEVGSADEWGILRTVRFRTAVVGGGSAILTSDRAGPAPGRLAATPVT
jgi:hypothetical protein